MTFHPHPAAHEFRQAPGDRQPQSGSTVFPGGGCVGLGKLVEDSIQLFRRYADSGITDGKLESRPGSRQVLPFRQGRFGDPDLENHFTPLGKLDGIAKQVYQNLAQAGRISSKVGRHLRLNMTDQFEPFLVGIHGHDFTGLVQQLGQVKCHGFQFDLAGLNFGQVKNIVDEIEENFPGRPEHVNISALFGSHGGLPEQFRHPDNGIHGSPDFVAHTGQKITLGLIGTVRRFLCLL